MKEIPKLWSFYSEKNFKKKIENISGLESHFSYMEDNFFILNFTKFEILFENNFFLQKENVFVFVEKLYFKYTEYLKKKPLEKNKINKISFVSTYPENNIFKSIFNSRNPKTQIKASNNQIQNSNYFPSNIDRSVYKSMASSIKNSIYESAVDYKECDNQDSNPYKETSIMDKTIYESMCQAKDVLLLRYNVIFESEYIHNSHNIFEISNTSISDKFCFVVCMYKEFFQDKEKANKNLIDNGADCSGYYFKSYFEIVLKKITMNFIPLFLYKISKMFYFTEMIINHFN